MHRVRANPARREIDRRSLGPITQRPFGRALVDGARRTPQSGDGRDIADRTATRAFHQIGDSLHPEKAAKLIDTRMTLEQRSVGLHDGTRDENAGVVHYAMQAAQ